MAKVQARSKSRIHRKHPGRGRKPRQSFYQRNRKQILLAGVGVLAAAIFLGTRSGPSESSSSAGAFTGGDFHSLVADSTNPGRIYAGGHEAVAASDDRGKTWQDVESLQGADAMGWGFDQETVYLGGHPGLSVSTDGGRTFGQSNRGLPATDLHSVGAGGGVVYAGSPAGLLASTDGTKTWQIRNPRAAQSFMGRILVEAAQPEHLIAPDLSAGVVESRDGGRSWDRLGGLKSAHWVSWDPKDVSRIVASGGGQSVESRDGGQTWKSLDVPAGSTIVELDPNDPQVLYAGAHDGERVSVKVSRDGGSTWLSP